jgi:hypothetical protein
VGGGQHQPIRNGALPVHALALASIGRVSAHRVG